MKQKTSVYPQRRIRTVSDKKIRQDREYRILRKEFFRDPNNHVCQARLPGCLYSATDVHHKRGRGIYYLITSTWLAVCRKCHSWITENSRAAILMGLSESRLNNHHYDKETSQTDTVYKRIPVDFDLSS
jgi:hypothetical protein